MRQAIVLRIIVGCVFFLSVFPSSTRAQLPAAEVAQLLRGQDIYYDEYGLIVHKGPDGKFDGGDTAQREGWYWLGVWIRQNTPGLQPWTPKRALTFDQVLQLLEPNKDGVFYRHPKQPPFNNPYDKQFGFSRDQMEPLVAAMGVWGKQATILRLWNALPEDLIGKHALNGDFRNFLGQTGPNCPDIKKRGCDATADCSLKIDNRDCSLQTDTRDCSLQTDNRDCSLQVDTRSCGHDISLPNNNTIHINDPACESAKAAQNAAYSTAKASCETAKTSQNALYAAAKTGCETAKAAQNALYASSKAACESAKATQNAFYASQKLACETGKTSGKYACEGQKQLDYQLCRTTNVHSGDIIGPMTVNLFWRALGKNPILPNSNELASDPSLVGGGLPGEAELLLNAHLRVAAAQDRNNVGDDLNLIVKLLMATLRFPSPLSLEATQVYATQRPPSYGSYLGSYYTKYGNDMTDWQNRMDAGIAGGWAVDAGISAPFGAVRWYHRPATGANPQLAELYSVIIKRFIK
jgi:hypothetical protein